MSDQYDFWRRRMAGEVIPIHDGEPQAGFYRIRHKNKETGEVSYSAIAYWFTGDGKLRCHRNGRDWDEQKALEAWTYASKNPITHEIYVSVVDRGEQWPDLNEAVIGHNQAPVDSSLEAIRDRIEDLAREAEKMIAAGAATTDAASDQASDLANTFGELEAKIKAAHKNEKQPFLDGGRAVDNKWFTLRDRAESLKKRLKAIVVTPFLTKKAEEVRKANITAISMGTMPEDLPEKRLVSGSAKRSTALRTYYKAEIEDVGALLDSLKQHPDLLACIQKIADAAAAKKIALPGCKVIEEKRAA